MRVSTVQTLAAYLDDEITAMPNLTSVGTLTALTVDDVAIDGKVITMTGSSGDTFVTTVAANGATSLVTTDAGGAAANLQITADGTVDIDSAGVLTLDSGAAINIEPAAGSAILLDGTISIDAGVVTGATSITSTAFVGNITGTVATATQNSITTATGLVSVGALDSGTITSGFGNIDTGSSTITTTGAVATGALTTTGASSITTADNLNTLSLISTDADANVGPNLRLYRNSSSPADNDDMGRISFDGRNDNSQDYIGARIWSEASDVSDGTEDAALLFDVMKAGTVVNQLNINPAETIFNETGSDQDMRIESSANANAFSFDGGTGQVGIGVAPAGYGSILTLAAAGNGSVQAGIDFDDTNSGDGYRLYANAGNFYLRNYDDGQTDLQVTAGGDTTIARGDLIFGTAGKGIVLGATSNTAANTLDDYEEGTYAVVLSGHTSGSFNMDSNNTFAYTKIGNLVSIQGYVGVSSGSVSGQLRINLPFTPAGFADDGEYNFSSLVLQNNGNTLAGQKYLFLTGNAYGNFYRVQDDGTAGYIEDGDVDSAFQFGVSFSYLAA